MSATANYWLVKTEPDAFSIQDLAKSPGLTTCWDGVRNYQARNILRDQMKLGDRVLIYHSSTDPTAIVGIAKVIKEGYPDHTAWDKKSPHYDPDSTKDNPRWYMVDLQLERIFDRPLTLDELRKSPAIKQMELLRRGSRLSVQPVRKSEFEAVLKLVDA
ncbi:MAG TPA: EVE domain-containing protein [Pirellulaceae bacterium]|nr:EVE domain-containing protein [Pirellulaceae bacterium]